MSTTTVHTHHLPTIAGAGIAALGLAAVLAAGAVVADRLMSDSSSGVPAQVKPADVPAAVEWRIGSPDALERSLTRSQDAYRGDPRYYGSPDAAERITGR